MITKEHYTRLCQELTQHNYLYYIEHQPKITDAEFDTLLKQLEKIEEQHPEWITPSSPSQRVGSDLTSSFQTVSHAIPMLSLSNTYNQEEIDAFIQRCQKNLEKHPFPLFAELKMDGVAISVIYQNGKLLRAVTRGNGREGDDVTANIRTIRSLPLEIYGPDIPELLEIRGEVFLPLETFHHLNKQRKEEGEEPWANPRNAASGTLKLLDPKEVARRQLQVVFYSVAQDSSQTFLNHSEIYPRLKQWNIPVSYHYTLAQTEQELWTFISEMQTKRLALPFEIDGIVIKIDNLKAQELLGSTAKSPRWAVAYKFAAEQARTQILDITVQVGRTGVLTPVAELDPVPLSGSIISRATLHNQEEIERKDIRVGDFVWIEKGGDVIPKVLSVDVDARTNSSVVWSMPLYCPSCAQAVQSIPGEVATRCINHEKCPEQVLRQLIYFVSKPALNIENLGEKVMEQLVKKKFVLTPGDIFRLDIDRLSQLDGFKEKAINNLLQSIEKSRKVSLERLLLALGIPYVGSGIADLLAQHYPSLDRLLSVQIDELLNIDGIGEKVACSVCQYFKDPAKQELLQDLISSGLLIQEPAIKTHHNHAYKGKSFVLTGTLEQFTRSEATKLIKERGGKVISSISKKTDYLLCGENAGSKLTKAEKLGITILNEKDFSSHL